MPDNSHQLVCPGLPIAHHPNLNDEERNTLGELLRHNTGEEVLAMAELWDQMPSDNDTFKAFAGAALGAAKSRGEALDNAMRRYNDALVKWKNTPHHQDRQRVNMRHVKPAFDDLHRTFNREIQRIADRKKLSAPERRALRNRRRPTRYLRHERNGLHLGSIADIQRLRNPSKPPNSPAGVRLLLMRGLHRRK